MSFENFDLIPELLRAVNDAGYTVPTPIQARAIPLAMAGQDLQAAAQTGTGKTAAFALPILQRLHATQPAPRGPRAPRALVLVPTRELAAQVAESFKDLGKHLRQRGVLVYGGVSPKPQVKALAEGVDIIVATPGRLLDHLQLRLVDLSRVEMLVLDEADRMLDMGFIRPIRRLLAALPAQRQNLLFFGHVLERDPRTGAQHPAQCAKHRHRAAQRARGTHRSPGLSRGHGPSSIRC